MDCILLIYYGKTDANGCLEKGIEIPMPIQALECRDLQLLFFVFNALRLKLFRKAFLKLVEYPGTKHGQYNS